jgi:hypothetical protein
VLVLVVCVLNVCTLFFAMHITAVCRVLVLMCLLYVLNYGSIMYPEFAVRDALSWYNRERLHVIVCEDHKASKITTDVRKEASLGRRP